jgi:prophage maintenance system killer protein
MLWNASLVLIGYGAGANKIWAIAIATLFMLFEGLNYRASQEKRRNTMK